MPRILLAGCGKIGTQLGLLMAQRGHQPVGLRRSRVAMPFICIQGDLSQPLADGLIREPIDYVVYTATPSEYSDAGYQSAYPAGVQHLLDALSGHAVKRFFFVSSTAVYHQNDGSWVDEDSATVPSRYNGVRVLEAETLLKRSAVPSTSIRFGGIYGAGRSRLLDKIRKGADAQASPPKYTNRIHQHDCVGVLAFLIECVESGKILDECYLGVDNNPVDEWTLYQWLAEKFKAPAPNPVAAGPDATQNKRCSNQRLTSLGYSFSFPDYRSGYAQ
ncbi:MAG: NAD-dependent epimerase/dehydratase family protein [Ketobacter sp.]|nr:MAG: NAD-dependent epimerase/dehydratase family protein [Ketobacter sp.]